MKRGLGIALLAATVAMAVVVPASADAKYEQSKNVKLIGTVKYKGGTELASSGKYVYTGAIDGETRRGEDQESGGLHIVDVSGSTPREVGFLDCPGHDNDVEVVKPGLVVMGFSTNKCAPSVGQGLMTIDVSNARKPRVLGAIPAGKNSHTLKPVPGTTLVYVSTGGLTPGGNTGPQVIDVKNPSRPKVVGSPKTITSDCHDISFLMTKEKKLGFCTGAVGTGEVHIWDMSDPLNPTMAGKIVNPLVQYSHYATASDDGKYLAVDDEAFAAHECHSGQSPTGRVWFYDISNPAAPTPVGSFAAPRGGRATAGIGNYAGWVDSWCLSHGLDWMDGTHYLGVTWFTGGWSVLSLDQTALPQEVAYFQDPEQSATYSILFHDGKLFTNDMHRGMDAFTIKGLK